MPRLSSNSVVRTTAKNKNNINFNSYRGIVNGNIFPKTPITTIVTCETVALDFSCEDNSQYTPIV